MLVARVERTGLLNGKPGGITIAAPLQAGRVIALVLGVRQRFRFRCSQFCVVTSFFPALASREVALVFCVRCLFGFEESKFGMVALVPAVLTILRIAPVLFGGHFFRFCRS